MAGGWARDGAVNEQIEASVNDEPGCRQFDVTQDPVDDASVFLYEIYDDEDAFKAHVASSHFKLFDKISAPWVKDKKVLTSSLNRQ